ncbi:unnamed protein product [Rotaria sordida]|uniref:Uncharacterized protein n=1 Tax=Rotaria sordida TaxID=392033 RepID=A0A816BBA4_9BILA|nr:unnamed protein product [Rotaria sordida]CAF1608042.1 unnamed protein product [Rotaria sordida]
MLRTSNYHKHKSNGYVNIPFIFCGSFETRSTRTTTINDHHLFYSNETKLGLCLLNRQIITWSCPLFQQIKYLVIQLVSIQSLLSNNLCDIVNSRQEKFNDYAKLSVDCFSHFVHLSNVTEIEFRSAFGTTQWRDIQYILQACPNVINLIINTEYLLLSELIDNEFLIPIFKQIKMIESITQNIYFPLNFASKFLESFPSLRHIKLQVDSFDNCVHLIEIFLIHLTNLSYLKINYKHNALFDDPFTCDYIIKKRRQTFPDHIFNEQRINVKNNGETIEIWLS